jgi:hypothetical protein
MGFRPLFLTILSVLGSTNFLTVSGANADVPLPPSQDPWYTSPPAYQSAQPGTILRLRHAPGNLSQVMGNCSAAYNILYRTTNSRYDPSWAVTTLYVPSIISTSSSLLSYQVPYNSIDVDASPSYSMYSEQNSDVANALGRGWFVTVPDFEGPLAANVAGIQEGHATIDSLRASISSNLGLSPEVKIALWGYSGGSIASEWALELQEQYAPELKIDGAALGGLVANNTRCIDVVEGTPLAYIAVGAMLGPLIEYPEAYNRLVSQLKVSGPYNKTGFLAAKGMNSVQGFAAYYNQSIYGYFVNGSAVLHDRLIRQVLLENQFMTYHGVPKCPLYIYKAIHDEATPVEDTDYYVERNCMLHANILYERNTVGGHIDEETNGDSRAVAWLESIFNGSYPELYQPYGCTIRNVTIDIADTGA